MRARVNMPVLGGHNRLVPVVVILNVFANERGDLGSSVGCQRPTGAEIVLNINNNECFCHETILENPWGSVKGGAVAKELYELGGDHWLTLRETAGRLGELCQ